MANKEIPKDFDWKIYLELNPDIASNPNFITEKGATNHWVSFGCNEGRSYKRKRFEKIIDSTKETPLYIFYHIGAVDSDYQLIVNEQVKLLKDSGLYKKADKIFYSIVGLQKIKLPDKFQCVYSNEDYTVAELPIMDIILTYSKHEIFNCLYFHTKGSGRNHLKTSKDQGEKWRKYMGYFNIELWESNIELLKDYDTVGASFMEKSSWYGNHYSGNFWWAKSSYIRTLNTVTSVDVKNQNDRFKAEMWLLQNPMAKHHNLFSYIPPAPDGEPFISPNEYRKKK